MGFIWKWDSPKIDSLSSWIICWDKAISGLRQKNMPYWFHWYLRWWYPDEFHVKYHYHCGSIPIVFQLCMRNTNYLLVISQIASLFSRYGTITYVCVCLGFPMGIFQKKVERWFPHVSYYWAVYWCWFHLTPKWSLGTSLVSLVSQFHYIAQYLLSVVPHGFSW